ncbi:MAG: DUF488 domain-containing protein [Deltaproteobacteria bacterium]|nr:DUF488 domain-containing protein [Deltaproteobacteria bacterium]
MPNSLCKRWFVFFLHCFFVQGIAVPSKATAVNPLDGCGEAFNKEGGAMPFVGIGTSNKKMDAYIKELKDQSVLVVVDVRARPQSQWFPHFNRQRLQASLAENGITYLWLGDKLGNPKDESGKRTLEGFKKIMETDAYKEGMETLMELARKQKGKIALTCSEGKESECHRKLILEDLQRRLCPSKAK